MHNGIKNLEINGYNFGIETIDRYVSNCQLVYRISAIPMEQKDEEFFKRWHQAVVNREFDLTSLTDEFRTPEYKGFKCGTTGYIDDEEVPNLIIQGYTYHISGIYHIDFVGNKILKEKTDESNGDRISRS